MTRSRRSSPELPASPEPSSAAADPHPAPGSRSAESLPRRRLTIALVGLALLGAALYAPTVGYEIVGYDDPWLFGRNNPLSKPSLSALRAVWLDLSPQTRLRLGSEYLPVRDMSVMLDFALFGRRYGGLHAVNVLLYGLLCALVGLMLLRLTGRPELSLFAALIYLAHPLHVESVAWLAERKGLLSAVFAVAAVVAYERFASRGGTGRWLAVAALVVLSTWSKALGGAAAGVIVFLWLAGWPRRPPLVALLGLALVAGAALAPVVYVGRSLQVVGDLEGGGGLAGQLALAAKVHARYLEHGALFGDLGIAYAVSADGSDPLRIVVGAAALLAVAAAAVFGVVRGRGAGYLPLAAALWGIFLLPASQLLVRLQNPIADRYTLLPSIGLALAVALLISRLSAVALRRSLCAALVAVELVFTVGQMRSWRDDEALYRQALRADPENAVAMVQLARLAREAGKRGEAQRWLKAAQATGRAEPRVALQRAVLLSEAGDRGRAIEVLKAAARRYPGADRVRANLALLLLRERRDAEAIAAAEEAARLRPLRAKNQQVLGVVALAIFRHEVAERALRRALALAPEDGNTIYNLAVLTMRKGQRSRALQLARQALRLSPGHRHVRSLIAHLERRGHLERQAR